MNALLRNHNRILKNGIKTYAVNNNNKYNKFSTTHYRSCLAQKYGLDRSVTLGGFTQSGRLYINHYTPVMTYAATAVRHDHSMCRYASSLTNLPNYHYNTRRGFQLNQRLYEQPSSKIEATVNDIKNKQREKEEEVKKENTSAAAAMAAQLPDNVKPVAIKKPLKTRIWEEIVHYYHGFRLLVVDINICRKLLWRVLNGKTMTRRENNLLIRTTSDLFRLIPFSVFIIVPFMELLLPVFIKFFPGMLPSTFQTAKEREDKLKQSLQVKLEMAKFLQKTLDEMAVQHKDHKSEGAKQFATFFQKIKDPNEYVSSEDIIKNAKSFDDEITLDSLSRAQLVALCRLLEINTMGTTSFLRFQLRMKLRLLAADDVAITREGVSALNLFELQQACKSRGMRAYGMSVERMRTQMKEWIDLSLNEKVPPILLLLSRALLYSEDTTTADKLKETIRVLPDAVGAQTKAAIGEREGKIDNKTKIEIIKEEERKIKEEREEEREVEKAKADAEEKVLLVDKAPTIETESAETIILAATTQSTVASEDAKRQKLATPDAGAAAKEGISSKDFSLLTEALKSLSSDKNKMLVEKEEIKELKEEMEDYKEDVQELHEVRTEVHEPVHETRAAKMLFKKVNTMIAQMDKVLADLEKQHQDIQAALPNQPDLTPEVVAHKRNQQVHIHELVNTIRKLKETSTDSRLKTIETVLAKIDVDKDGIISVDEVLKVVEAIGHENVNLDEKQLEELLTLLDKEQIIEAENRIDKAIAKSIKEANQIKEALELEEIELKAKAVTAAAEELKDMAPELKDNATNLDLTDERNVLKTETKSATSAAETSILETAKKQNEKIMPTSEISSKIPPTATTSTQANPSKDKML